MTIKELYNANKNMGINDTCVIRCKYEYDGLRSVDDILDGCIIYQDDYYTMPKVLKGLEVLTFKRLKDSSSNEESNKWEIWVV